jgi:hypothetical protein
MRDRAVQSKIVSKREMPLWPALHDNKPAPGSDLDRYAVIGAIPLDGIHERSLFIEHL